MKAVRPRSKSCCPCSVSITPFLVRRASRTFRVSSSADSRRESVAFGMPVARSAEAKPASLYDADEQREAIKIAECLHVSFLEHSVANFKSPQPIVPNIASMRAIKLALHRRPAMTTTFTPKNSALLLIDHQVGTMQLIRNIDVAQAKHMSLALAKAAASLASRPC